LFNPLNTELNPIYHLLALLGGATIVVVSRLRVKERVYCYKEWQMIGTKLSSQNIYFGFWFVICRNNYQDTTVLRLHDFPK